MKNTLFLSVIIFGLIFCQLSFGESEFQLSVNASPYGSVPLSSSRDVFNSGLGISLSGSIIPSSLKYFGLQAGGEYLSLPLKTGGLKNSIWTLSGSAGPFFRIPFGRRFSIYAGGRVGYYYRSTGEWDSENFSGGGFYTGGGVGGLFRVSGPFTLGAGVSYDYYSELYNGLRISLSGRLDFPGLKEETGSLELRDIKLLPLFPVLYSHYARNTLGSVRVVNNGDETVDGINIRFYMERYMDNPMDTGAVFSLGPGEDKVVDLYALFTEDLMEITEGTRVSAGISLIYPGRKNDFVQEYSGMVDFYNRNAMMWDDDRKIASFITAKDPEILNYAKNIISWMQEIKNPALDENLQKGIALFEGIKSYGIRYEVDPATPFTEYSGDSTAIDFLQFPRQTLQYTNGDCDDLTALYTALLEAVGVESAFITVPGHIFAAFALKSSVREAEQLFNNRANLIFIDDVVWVPIEITLFQESFEQAWMTGAKEWREHSSAGQAILYPVRESWNTYQAVGFMDSGSQIELPGKAAVIEGITDSVEQHVEREIFPQVKLLEERLAQGRNSLRTLNRLALVYARYGRYDKAMEYYEQILSETEYPPALTNVANIHFLRENYGQALDYYNRTLTLESGNKSALIGAARCNYEMENYGFVKQTMASVRAVDPELAERFAYLELRGDDSARASDITALKNTVIWGEEEE